MLRVKWITLVMEGRGWLRIASRSGIRSSTSTPDRAPSRQRARRRRRLTPRVAGPEPARPRRRERGGRRRSAAALLDSGRPFGRRRPSGPGGPWLVRTGRQRQRPAHTRRRRRARGARGAGPGVSHGDDGRYRPGPVRRDGGIAAPHGREPGTRALSAQPGPAAARRASPSRNRLRSSSKRRRGRRPRTPALERRLAGAIGVEADERAGDAPSKCRSWTKSTFRARRRPRPAPLSSVRLPRGSQHRCFLAIRQRPRKAARAQAWTGARSARR